MSTYLKITFSILIIAVLLLTRYSFFLQKKLNTSFAQIEVYQTESSPYLINYTYIGDMRINTLTGDQTTVKNLFKDSNTVVAVVLRATDCSLCSDNLLNVISNNYKTLPIVFYTTSKNIKKIKIAHPGLKNEFNIANVGMVELSKYFNSSEGPYVFIQDTNFRIVKNFNAKGATIEEISAYLDHVVMFLANK